MKLDQIKEYCRTYLDGIPREGLFIYYTIHSESHSSFVWEISKKIAKKSLTKYELNFLKASCWCHDLGLAKWKKEDNYQYDNPDYCNFVRENHHRRSEEFINSKYAEMGLTEEEANIIGGICYAHSSKADINDLNDENYINIDGKKEKIRTKLLAAILRVADALDARKDRIPPKGYRIDAPFESKIEYSKHLVIEKVDIKNTEITIKILKGQDEIIKDVKEKLTEEYNSVGFILKKENLISNLKFKYSLNGLEDAKIEEEIDYMPPEVKRIMELYVKPSIYDKIINKLDDNNVVIITGDANVGKTSTAYYIAGFKHKENKQPILILKPGEKISIPQNSTVIIDDAFGESQFKDKGDYVGINEINDIKESNHVIITSRKQVLIDAVRESRIGEYDYKNWTVELGQEGSYQDDELKKILINHVKFYRKIGKITEDEAKIATNNEKEIINSLRFPHNIDIFVKEKLKEVKDIETLKNAIENSKHIKKVAKKWFLNLEDTRKFFVFTVWLFQAPEDILNSIYPRIIKKLRKRKPELEIGDITDLINQTSSYIKNGHQISFRHSNYKEGVSEAIGESYKDFIKDIIPLFLEFFENEDYKTNDQFDRVICML